MAVENGEESPSYRSSKAVPFELVQHSGIFSEEKLCPLPYPGLRESI